MDVIVPSVWFEFERMIVDVALVIALGALGLVVLEMLLLAAFAAYLGGSQRRSHHRGGMAVLVAGLGLSTGVASAQEAYRPVTPLGLDEFYRVPDSNPLMRERVALGARLFLDPLLSADGTIACASCHRPDRAFSDTIPFSKGVYGRSATRNTPSILNRAYGRAFFLDGRATSLEETVLQPIQNPREMGLNLQALVARLQRDESYAAEFGSAFDEGITEYNIARALASYVRSLRSGHAPFDRFSKGDRAALSPEAQAGLRLFVGKANCAACHTDPTFTDEQVHNTGVFVGSGDVGRYAVSAQATDSGAFKTPTLRNVALTAPYMHDGSLATLNEVVELYNGGGIANRHLDPEIGLLHLTGAERARLVAFLKALTGDWPFGRVADWRQR